jgi:hypothetical protein
VQHHAALPPLTRGFRVAMLMDMRTSCMMDLRNWPKFLLFPRQIERLGPRYPKWHHPPYPILNQDIGNHNPKHHWNTYSPPLRATIRGSTSTTISSVQGSQGSTRLQADSTDLAGFARQACQAFPELNSNAVPPWLIQCPGSNPVSNRDPAQPTDEMIRATSSRVRALVHQSAWDSAKTKSPPR